MRITGIVLAVLLLSAGAVEAREYAPRVVSPHRADAYSMQTFRQFTRWRDLDGDALAWEVYKYLVDTRSGVFHVNEVLEGRDALSEYRIVRDPVKIINVYGYGFCGLFGPVMEGVWKDMGAGRARTLALPDWSHMTSEVFYDGGWHYVDLDVRAVFRRDDGTLASIADARRDPSLWKGRGPLFFPNDPLQKTRQVYLKTPVQHYYGFNQSGHTMDYVLRQGETFTRWWTPQGGRWHHRPEWNRVDWLRRLIEQEPRGPKPNHRHFTIHNYANGRFVYRPNLTAGSTDFRDGAWDATNVRPADGSLTVVEPGEGFAVFEVRSPYVIVPVVGDLDTTADDREASVVRVDGRGLALAISLDGGLSWRDLTVDARPAVLDLTPHVAGTYGYLLKVMLRGRPGEAVLRSLEVTTWVQVAPAALPVLHGGTNRMTYCTGDHYGLKTRVVEVRSDASRPEDLVKYCAEPPADYDPSRKTARIRGPVVAKVEAPPGTKIAWFSAQGSFRTHQGQAARNTHNTMAWAADKPENFREIYRADMPTDVEHWHTNVCREVRLDRPADRVFVRYVGDPAVNNFHVYAHCRDDGRPSARPVTITHTWREGDAPKRRTATLQEPGPYEIAVEGDPVCASVEIAVPSDAP
jgi:hypothetical protein